MSNLHCAISSSTAKVEEGGGESFEATLLCSSFVERNFFPRSFRSHDGKTFAHSVGVKFSKLTCCLDSWWFDVCCDKLTVLRTVVELFFLIRLSPVINTKWNKKKLSGLSAPTSAVIGVNINKFPIELVGFLSQPMAVDKSLRSCKLQQFSSCSK